MFYLFLKEFKVLIGCFHKAEEDGQSFCYKL